MPSTARESMGIFKKHGDSSSASARPPEGNIPPYETEWEAFNLKIFRLVLDAAAVVFLALVIRGLLSPEDSNPIADGANLAVLVGLRVLASLRPDWRRSLGWAALASFAVNALVKFEAVEGTLPDSYSLHPLVVLFAALTGDAALSAAALVFVMGLYAIPLFYTQPLPSYEMVELGDLVILTLAAGACSYAAWLYHRMLSRELFVHWRESRRQADLNRRLTAALFHDIANPLFVIRATADIAVMDNKVETADMERIGRMCAHIESIREAVRGLENGRTAELDNATVSVAEIAAHLGELFAPHLNLRELELAVAEGADLTVRTDRAVLCNSVLGNFLSNAVRHAPSRSRITLSGRIEGDEILLELRDRGDGFTREVLHAVAAGKTSLPRVGQEGRGYGLWIASSHLARLGGTLDLGNHPEGGAAVTVRLPAS
jgi:signal transduction histidine kinase